MVKKYASAKKEKFSKSEVVPLNVDCVETARIPSTNIHDDFVSVPLTPVNTSLDEDQKVTIGTRIGSVILENRTEDQVSLSSLGDADTTA
ncbi:MAG: hypothetical protein FJ333_11330 [Sphingomonadales bacterium]|nr:hypothetical protein [Sphingomonadales bacterium]